MLEQTTDVESEVARYLLDHPDFLRRHPRVLSALDVPHRTGGAVSLIEQQVRVLRKQLETERHRLAHLISRARDYEALSMRLHHLSLKLIAVNDSRAFCTLLQETLLSELSAEAMALKLFATDTEDAPGQDALTLAFQDFVDRHHALCGPLDDEKARMLFGTLGNAVRSAALVPLRAEGHAGVLAIGSRDPERFRPEMGTELLDRLGEIVAHKLHVLPLGDCDLVRLGAGAEVGDPAGDVE